MNKYYNELTLIPNSYKELYIDLLNQLSDDAIEDGDNKLILRSEDDLENIIDGIKVFTESLKQSFNENVQCEITYEQKENIDWVEQYQRSVREIEVGEFFIHPSWVEPSSDKLNILIDPSLAFGSGHHETTSTCLEAVSKYVQKDMEVADVGCGSGILGIAASKKGAKVDICDTDEAAVNDSLKNFRSNNVQQREHWVGSITASKSKYDVTIANIVADVLIFIASDLKKSLKENGILILSGILDKFKDKVLAKFNDMETIEVIQKNEWVTLVLRSSK